MWGLQEVACAVQEPVEQAVSGPGSHAPFLLPRPPAPCPNGAEHPAVGRGKPFIAPGSMLAEQAKRVTLELRDDEPSHWPSKFCELAANPDLGDGDAQGTSSLGLSRARIPQRELRA